MNLLKETEEGIKDSGHTPADIVFIGSEESGHQCSWEEFCLLADVEYDGFGGQEVAGDLVVVFSDGQKMWRGEGGGSEWWEFSTAFVKPAISLPISQLVGNGSWQSLKDINEKEPT